LEHSDINSISSSIPAPSCEIYRLVDRLTVNFQVGIPFAPDVSEPVNYVNKF